VEINVKIQLSKGGKLQYIDKSLSWRHADEDFSDTSIAGQQMIACKEDGKVFLMYMGYKATDFADMAQARKEAPDFACQVFDLLKQRVIDFPTLDAKPPRHDDSSDCTP
jgi:hypothetical protein